MGSRARIAAGACVVATGLLVGGPCAVTAFADSPSTAGSDDVSADQRQEKSPRRERPSEDAGPAAENPDGEVKTRSGRAPGDDGGGGEDEENPRPPCCEDGSRDCGPDWSWPQPQDPSDSDGDYGENRPETGPPAGPMPPQGTQGRSDVLDTIPGIGPDDPTQAPIDIPVIVARPSGLAPAGGPAGGAAPAAGGAGAGSPAAPRPGSPSQPRRPQPVAAGSGSALPATSYRLGYAEHLRAAGIPQLAVLALPGLAGILVLTGAGGLVGYRQAKAGQGMRPTGIARFMN